MPRHTRTDAQKAPQASVELRLPHLWAARSYQLGLKKAMPSDPKPEGTRKRFCCVWHRRAGKDLTALALTAREMASRVGYYMHVFPTLKQGKAIVWDGKDNAGIPFTDRFPRELILERNETECQIVLKPLPGQPGYGDPKAKGSIWQLRGADDPDSLRGGNCIGVVFSEFQQMDKVVWNIVEPILLANGGWAAFLFTPECQNHAYDLYNTAKANQDKWFCSKLTVEDTRCDAAGESGERVVSQEDIDQARKENSPEEFIQQEYYCSFSGFLRGTIFGDLVTKARLDKRVGQFPWNANAPVGTCWDIGRYDQTGIWFYQKRGDTIFFIDYIEDRLKGAHDYAKLVREKPYITTSCILPHDAKHKGFSATQSTEEFLSRSFQGVTVADKTSVQSQIDATRRMFSRFCFDEIKCRRGIECLEKYRRKYDEKLNAYSGEPMHDEYSHGASAMMTGTIGGLEYPLNWRDGKSKGSPAFAETNFDVFAPVEMVQ
jgi:hypothetical protein